MRADPLAGSARAGGRQTSGDRWSWGIALGGLVLGLGVLAALALVLSGGHGTHASHTAGTVGGPSAVDIGFSQDMAAHHAQAVTMGRMAERHGSPQIRGVAHGIVDTQLGEIGYMQGWLALWDAPSVPTGRPMTWMHHGSGDGGTDAHAHHTAPGSKAVSHATTGQAVMSGMATPTQLARLDRLRGRAFDISFLQLMTRHHQGGIEMAHEASKNARLRPVREFADRTAAEQVQEIGLMLALLRAAGGRPLTSP